VIDECVLRTLSNFMVLCVYTRRFSCKKFMLEALSGLVICDLCSLLDNGFQDLKDPDGTLGRG
jgi:hypothetical protein